MKLHSILYYLVLTVCIFIVCSTTSVSQNIAPSDLIFDHQDPAGDVLVFNATLNGTPIDAPEFEALDLKWVYSDNDLIGNMVLKMDLKSKNKFINEDETKYVFRMLTTPDNTTGFNITYQNQTAILVPFSSKGNGTPIDISNNVSFIRDKGDELMEVTVSISKYLTNLSHFSLDAYSMKVTNNATYLDYICEVPGHPEYVNPEVQEGENLDTSNEDDNNEIEEDSNSFIIGLVTLIIVMALVFIILTWLSRKRNKMD